MAQVIDTTGRSKGFSKKEWVPPVRVPNRRPSGRVNDNANYVSLANDITTGFNQLADAMSTPVVMPSSYGKSQRKDWSSIMAPVSDLVSKPLSSTYQALSEQVPEDERMTPDVSFPNVQRIEQEPLPMRGVNEPVALTQEQIDELRRPDEELLARLGDLYDFLNQPQQDNGPRSSYYTQLGKSVSDALNEPMPEQYTGSPRQEDYAPYSEPFDTSGMMSAEDVHVPEIETWTPPATHGRGYDWASIMAPVSNAITNDLPEALEHLASQSNNGNERDWASAMAPVSSGIDDFSSMLDRLANESRSNQERDWASLMEPIGRPIDEHLEYVGNYRAPVVADYPMSDAIQLPSVTDGIMLPDAASTIGNSGQKSAIQPAADWIDSKWNQLKDAVANQWEYAHKARVSPEERDAEEAYYTAPLQTGDNVLPGVNDVDGLLHLGTSSDALTGNFEMTPYKESEIENLVQEAKDFTGIDPDMVGDTEDNRKYMEYFVSEGADPDDLEEMVSRDSAEILSDLGNGTNDQQVGDASVIDDGTSYDYDHATSNWMTGTQYMHYVELGMGGRPIDEIDPRAEYNKMEESINYGFVPFTPDAISLGNRALANAALAPGRLAGEIGNVRHRFTPDYTIEINGKSVSGREFDRKSNALIQQVSYYHSNDPDRFTSPPDDGRPYTAYVYEYGIENSDGTVTYHHGSPVSARMDDTGENIIIDFSDGTHASVPGYLTDEQINAAISGVSPQLVRADDAHDLPDDIAQLNDSGATWAYFYPDMRLDDGTSLPYEDVLSILYDETPDDPTDDGVSYEFSNGPVNNRPARLMQQEMISRDEDGSISLNFDDIWNNAVDFTAGSLPISMPGLVPWVFSVPNALASIAGVDPSTYDVTTGSYLPIAGYYDDNGNLRYGVQEYHAAPDEQWAAEPVPPEYGGLRVNDDLSDYTRYFNALGNALVPLTEQMAGSVGGSDFIGNVLGVSDEAMERIVSPTVGRLLFRDLYGPAGEGLEEIAGNHFDELTGYGPWGMWSNQAVDENGKPVYDSVGREVRDYSTGLMPRIRNATDLATMGNAFLGGALVSGVMGIPGIPHKLAQYGNAARTQADLRAKGISPYVKPEDVDEEDVPEEYLEKFSDDVITW